MDIPRNHNEHNWQEFDNNPEFLEWFKIGWGVNIAEKKFGTELANNAADESGRQLMGISKVPESLQKIVNFIKSTDNKVASTKTYSETICSIKKNRTREWS